ncbi:MAG: S41 family peptidase [Actinomycetota bacterium]
MTVLKQNAVARWAIAATLVLAGSCAPVSHGSFAQANAPYDVVEAEKTLAFGYTSIVERHLERVSAASVAIEGMRGLSSIDPEVNISRLGNRVLLSASDRVVAEYPAPAEDDIHGWARLTVTVALDARNVSQAVRDADVEKVYEAAFDATLARLDVFSRYAGAKEARDHRASRNGFGGIGIKFDMIDNEARIIEVMDDTPAAKAGMRVGDVISEIEGEPVRNWPRADISNRLRGPVASDIGLTLKRGAGAVQVSMRRALIVPPTVTMTVHDGVAEFKITSFNQRTAASLNGQLKQAREQLGAGIKGVVLDLRGNPGGLLDQAVAMADIFIADGPILSTKGRHPSASQHFEARSGDAGEDLPVVVLVDGKSASAAEIVASALQDTGRAVVVGTNSYGKGTVQTVIRLPNDGEMTLTWSRFHTPTGYALHGLGVLPTLCTADGATTTAGVLDGLVHASYAPVASELARWRHASLEETDLRKRLRTTCPSSAHASDHVDMEVAERLLADRTAYGRALALSIPGAPPEPAQAQEAPAVQQVHQ